MINSQEMLEAASGKTREGFTRIYKAVAPLLLGYIHKFIADSTIINSILDKTIVHIFLSINEFDDSKLNFTSWVLSIARGKCYEYGNNVMIHGETPFELTFFNGYQVARIAKQLNKDEREIKQNMRNTIQTLRTARP